MRYSILALYYNLQDNGGGFSVNNATLNRFFSLHYLLPFVLAALAIMHMMALHTHGSSNPTGVSANSDRLAMHPYFTFKDLVTIFLFFLVFSLFVFYAPNKLGFIGLNNNNVIDINFTKIMELVLLLLVFTKPYGIPNSSETLLKSTSLISKDPYPDSSQFYFWLAGLIDGDGYLGVYSNGTPSGEITLGEHDLSTLEYIRNKIGGNLGKRTGKRAWRWRSSAKRVLLPLVQNLNGKLLLSSKHDQLITLFSHFNLPNPITNNLLSSNTAWLSGFFDAEGYLSIRNISTLTLSIGQKDRNILQNIVDVFKVGTIYHDISSDTYNYVITD